MLLKLSALPLVALSAFFVPSSAGDLDASVPGCTCTTPGGGWICLNTCPNSNQDCSQLGNISANLSCSASAWPNPCAMSGSVTVAYDSCTTMACVYEFHSLCNTTACSTSSAGPFLMLDGDQASPSIGACCETAPTTCNYNFQVDFYDSGTTCPGTQPTTCVVRPSTGMYCRWGQQFRCVN